MVYGAASVEAKSLTLGEVLRERFPLAVPRYQRAYAWDDEAVNYFVRDVEAMLESPAGHASHFFGGLVCIQISDHERVRPTSYEVVDGQQRLATLMLALSCVTEAARDIESRATGRSPQTAARAKTLADETTENLITWKDSDVSIGTTTVRRRLSLSLADDAVFESLVLGATPPRATRESHSLLCDARSALAEMIRRYVGTTGRLAARMDRLVRLRQALVEDSHVVHIVSRERQQAYRLFSVLNHRGESLSDADLLRSRTLELLEGHPTQQEQAARTWDDMLGKPARDVESFFTALYPSVAGKRANGDLFVALESQFLPASNPRSSSGADSLLSVVERFRDELDEFVGLSKGAWPFDRQSGAARTVRSWQVDRLRRLVVNLKHDLSMPILLAGARSLDETTFAELVYMLEIFAFRYKIICNGHATRLGNIYYDHALRIRAATKSAPYSLNQLRTELRVLLADKAGDSLFRQLLVERLRYSNSSQRINVKEFLTVLEDHHTWWLKTGKAHGGAKPKPSMTKVTDIDAATLEHIYPQHAAGADKDPELEPLKHTLGNLTFFGANDNVAAGNKSFLAKRDAHYKVSEIGMTVDLADLPGWHKSSLDTRTEELLDWACRVFII